MRRARMPLVVVVLLLAGARIDDGSGSSTPVSIVKHYSPADRLSGRYQYVPFEVPPGSASLKVSYQYDRANGENVVDLGLFEPGSLELGTRAFRGYSGGAKPEAIISEAMTTPGYRPGPLPPGTWHALLGLYRVRDSGVDVTLTVEATPGMAPRLPKLGNVARPPLSAGNPRWFTGALHTHTLHSDGTVDPIQLLKMFGESGFDFVVITDHNNTTHRYEVQPRYSHGQSPLWIVGEEVTTPSGHASVWGLDENEWIDFRVRAEDHKIGELVATAGRYGALFSINHPVSECVGCGWQHEIVSGIDGIEISNGRHGEVDKALDLWDSLLEQGRRITGVGSSDWHSAPNPIDVANVRVFAPALTENAILAAIRSGRVIVMNGARPTTPAITVRAGGKSAGIGDSLTIGTSALSVDVVAPDFPGGRVTPVLNGVRGEPFTLDATGRARVTQRAEPGYVRFELRTMDGSPAAYTNPVYLVRP